MNAETPPGSSASAEKALGAPERESKPTPASLALSEERYQVPPENSGPLSSEADQEKLLDLREKLGLPSSRRTFLKGAAFGALGALAAPHLAPEAHAQSPERLYTPEQQERYDQGLTELRESARTALAETSRVFVARTDGSSEWIDTALMTMNQKIEGVASAITVLDTEKVEAAYEQALQGGQVELLHTHPTRVIEDALGSLPKAFDRIPPSPMDVLSVLALNKNFDPKGTAAERIRQSVVTEAGVWEYGLTFPQAQRDLQKSLDAAQPSLTAIDRYEKQGTTFVQGTDGEDGEYDHAYMLSDFSDELMKRAPADCVPFLEVLKVTGSALLTQPQFLNALGDVLDALPLEDMSEGARVYGRTIQEAVGSQKAALRLLDPSVTASLFEAPAAQDLKTYLTNWRKRGVSMTFKPFKEAGMVKEK